MRILIIEDEKHIAEPVKMYLEQHGFAVDFVQDGKEGYQQAQIVEYDCVVLDLNLPGMDGVQICQNLRQQENNVPVIMLTARTLQKNKIEGLESGADDYLTKPFHMKELLLRIQTLIKRNGKVQNEIIQIGDLEIDTAARALTRAGVNISLNNKEFGILEYLARNQGRVVSQEELLEHVWNDEIDPFSETVKTNIKTLRQKIDPSKSIIMTKRGQGYIIVN
jgi:two-component system OmpR family response regulator